ncbi:hypothetical protein PPERSA_10642 [Pseudocohnilembus persalinus]|uniref:Uncharacterized protein n=1 Tax=Pseudocohnilembus persalinus TaxID=266149 RepID=A0A0V0QD58_PSEPJ|nr:hypothetical protein PPERSA_10642 [Pseudocohnilembus persalinus]|eukprot:KRX00143.1 hypothetical protein PPERSA_10642 [Pseudocohnilembus persalinus]
MINQIVSGQIENFDVPVLEYISQIMPQKEVQDVMKSQNFQNMSGEFKGNLPKKSFFNNFFAKNTSLELLTKAKRQFDNKKKEKQFQQEIFHKIGQDYEIALLIADEIIPFSLEYYLQLRGDPQKKMQNQHTQDGIIPYEQQIYDLDDNEEDINTDYQNQDNDCQIF